MAKITSDVYIIIWMLLLLLLLLLFFKKIKLARFIAFVVILIKQYYSTRAFVDMR